MTLPQWALNRWLTKQAPDPKAIRELLELVDRDLPDSRQTGLSADRRLSCAYTAALQAAAAALCAEGYRTTGGGSHHFYAIQSLAHTIGAEGSLIRQVDDLRRKRNTAEYSRAGLVSEAQARQAVEIAERVRDAVVKWLREKHPDLVIP